MEKMTQEREARILQAAIDKFGRVNQMVVAIEELSELQKALTKMLRAYLDPSVDLTFVWDETTENIREEMADVSIMLNQLALIFGEDPEIEIEKLERLERRIHEDG